MFKYFISSLGCGLLGVFFCFSAGNAGDRKEINPFETSDIIIGPVNKICVYDNMQAACNQLLVYLFIKDQSIQAPQQKDIAKLDEVLSLIHKYDGMVIGQVPQLAMIQVKTNLEENLFKLKGKLDQAFFVQSTSFNLVAKFDLDSSLK